MFFTEWGILIVDDEPDILQVSRLAMQHFEVYGLPLRLHTASSKAQALQMFQTAPALLPSMAVAFIDVVMETDTAGLELCQVLREEQGNRVTQLFIRTGSPASLRNVRSLISRTSMGISPKWKRRKTNSTPW